MSEQMGAYRQQGNRFALKLATSAFSDATDPGGAASGHDLWAALTRAADAVEVTIFAL